MWKKINQFLSLDNKIIVVAATTSLMWALLIPVWHFPDEQAHFVQVQNTAENGGDPKNGMDVSQEVLESEQVLATLRDERGNNKYTYNPDYNLNYGPGFSGEREQQLKSLPSESRRIYLKKESPRYPPLFYWYSSVWYRLAQASDLFTRILMVRFGSTLLFAAVVAIALRIGKELFPKQKSAAMSVAALTAFHPMLVFVSSGINSDTLITLISSALTLLCLRLVKNGFSIRRIIGLALLLILGMLTKQTIFFLSPLILVTFVITIAAHPSNVKKIIVPGLFMLLSLGVAFLMLKQFNQGFWMPYWPLSVKEMLSSPSLIPSLFSLLGRVYRETLPWYWGVFKWLGVVFPLPLIRLFKLVMVISALGWGSVIVKAVIHRRRIDNIWLWITLILGNIGYVFSLIFWELSAILRLGFGHGIQGRYFFPLIISQMALLYFGWLQLVPKSAQSRFNKMLTIGLVGLGIYSLWYVMSLYYSLDSMSLFVQHVSQYKASIAKWPWILGWAFVWIASLMALVINKKSRAVT